MKIYEIEQKNFDSSIASVFYFIFKITSGNESRCSRETVLIAYKEWFEFKGKESTGKK
jgi:hypothetical protein